MRCSQLSQERLKLWTSNLAGTFASSLRAKGHKNFWRQRGVGVSRDCPFLRTPYYLRNAKSCELQTFPEHLQAQSEQKAVKNFGHKGVWAYQGLSKILNAAIYRAHRAVVFAIEQLSCLSRGLNHFSPKNISTAPPPQKNKMCSSNFTVPDTTNWNRFARLTHLIIIF